MINKPSFILKGRIVTMQSENDVINNGYVAIKDGKIVAISKKKEDLPQEFSDKKLIDTKGTIYPGLMDLHNHFVYNVLPLWVVPRLYSNRSQWPAHREYKAGVSKPIRDVLAKYSESAKAVVRYVEVKALISGTTTGQGIRTKVNGGSKIFDGAMRNVEEPKSDILPPAGTLVPDLVVSAQDKIDAFRRAINNPGIGAYFYHLSEGIDDRSRKHFSNLQDLNLINSKLVGIHALGLQKDDLKFLAEKGAKIVWSPFSNQLLYGKTINLKDLKDSNVLFSIGCDWSPTGSKNMLQELKVAHFANKEQGSVFTPYELVKAATSDAAVIAGWSSHLGKIKEGMLADLVVISGDQGNAYEHLFKAREKDIELVVVDGVPRYGDMQVMKSLHGTNTELEEFSVGGIKKGIYLLSEGSQINNLGFSKAIETLKDIMGDLNGYLKKMQEQESTLMSDGIVPVQEFTIELDNEFEIHADAFEEYEVEDEAALFADVPMADSVDFDTPTVEGENYWNRINTQKNISAGLIEWLNESYK